MRINRPHHNDMQNRMKKPVVPCEALRNGVAALSYAAATTYGTGKTIQYRSKDGSYVSAASFAEILKEASFEDASIARAAAALSQADVPEQGVKTALIMLNALLERGAQVGCTEDAWQQISAMLDFGISFAARVAAENNGQVVGGGLTLLTLCRPMRKYGRDHQCEQAADVVIYALEQPLLKLAEAAGFDGYEVFERVKALAPNQFFSLHQVGIENSIRVDAAHTDYIRVGLDLQKGTVRDLQTAGVMENVETVQQVLQFVKQSVKAVLDVASAI